MSLTAHPLAAVQPLAPSKNTSLKSSFLLGVLWVTPVGQASPENNFFQLMKFIFSEVKVSLLNTEAEISSQQSIY